MTVTVTGETLFRLDHWIEDDINWGFLVTEYERLFEMVVHYCRWHRLF